MLKAGYDRSQTAWAGYDYEVTKMYLQKILDKASEIPEPALLHILGLTLLPALRQRKKN